MLAKIPLGYWAGALLLLLGVVVHDSRGLVLGAVLLFLTWGNVTFTEYQRAREAREGRRRPGH